jgi:hypothetical protein
MSRQLLLGDAQFRWELENMYEDIKDELDVTDE